MPKTVVCLPTCYVFITSDLFIPEFTTSTTSSFPQDPRNDSRAPIPKDFMWGAATAAYQIEGGAKESGAKEGGRGASIWDAFSHTPGKTYKGQTGDVAIDHFHRYKEDVALLKQIGLKGYRFSLSWSRIIPAGVGDVNEEGVDFYNRLIDELLANGITPFVTLYHWDLPLALQTEYDGWLGDGTQVHDAFVAYARVCFDRFGDRVKNWITLNEPWVHSVMGLALGVHAPVDLLLETDLQHGILHFQALTLLAHCLVLVLQLRVRCLDFTVFRFRRRLHRSHRIRNGGLT